MTTSQASIPTATAPAASGSAAALPWPIAGRFSGKMMLGPHEPSATEMLSHDDLLGLPLWGRFAYGNLKDEDGELQEWLRLLAPGAHSKFFVQSSAGADTLRLQHDLCAAAATSYTERADDGTAVWTKPEGAEGNSFDMRMAPDGSRFTWQEEGILDITGVLLGPGLQWYLPDRQGSQLYVSQLYEVSGTALGKTVKGVIAFDKTYLPAGQNLYSGDDPLFRPDQHHRTWYTWATVYTDGTFDGGHFILGSDRMAMALLTNERGELTLDTDITGEVRLAPDGATEHILIRTSAGAEWEFFPDPKGAMPDMDHVGINDVATPQREGRWALVGDKREPSAWFAWGEVASHESTDYIRHYRH
ncbi:hypothetical protein IRT45_08885 [Nocardia sp. BSTN01]|uniref:hypothetical protein n=1 Tax=Nocardia sp. BSTN01 TaxID=2783665 RepID=UPI00188F3AFC|nr:hypothetical protein [Nocardia sp. BSTN01]MBF4997270.1 hypothetical protein [Nocardia sp. BSTN01]